MADFDGCRIDLEKEIKIDKELGRGAFGIIRKGVYNKRSVAVKTLNLQSDVDPIERFKAFTEFRREVWLMRYISR